MISLPHFISNFPQHLEPHIQKAPWEITNDIKEILEKIILTLGDDFKIENGIAIHRSVTLEKGVTLKRPIVVMENCFIGANAYFREGVFLANDVKIGPGCEIKSSIICSETAVAHFNYIGNSIIGQHVNFEAGSIVANHYNEREEKEIQVLCEGEIIKTGVVKFGALVGDHCKIGANAVLSPGTILKKNSTVKRLEMVEQVK